MSNLTNSMLHAVMGHNPDKRRPQVSTLLSLLI
jgi:hypothetical protein